eukprot:CAMPEP_0194573568 /NCGR_PEP_ID=MMETSP0292-20121207/9735_1 /TAXON_ID=39354 /ORGANISM="Heterosigma akashiwo, Strain CCMP2393" /LENGTH=974 /DNA_ID=CAMNT_0039424851 /DNA_START=89 /DNA_END=3013 /DNA_ORIENTATION=-
MYGATRPSADGDHGASDVLPLADVEVNVDNANRFHRRLLASVVLLFCIVAAVLSAGDLSRSSSATITSLYVPSSSPELGFVLSTNIAEDVGQAIVGSYTDPHHPGMYRRVFKNEWGRYFVEGTDNGTTKWLLPLTVAENGQLLIDFSPKGGPKDLVAEWDGSGIVFSDGNKWPVRLAMNEVPSLSSTVSDWDEVLPAGPSPDALEPAADEEAAPDTTPATMAQEEEEETSAAELPAEVPTQNEEASSEQLPAEAPAQEDEDASAAQPPADEPAAAVALPLEQAIQSYYTDPHHPGMYRKVFLNEWGRYFVEGTDDGQHKWLLPLFIKEDSSLVIDFTPKGGPQAFLAEWDGTGIVFSDGNKWSLAAQKPELTILEGKHNAAGKTNEVVHNEEEQGSPDEEEKERGESPGHEESAMENEEDASTSGLEDEDSEQAGGHEKKNKIDKTCTKVFEGVPEAKDLTARVPPNFEKVTINLWDHPDVQKDIAEFDEDVVKACVTQNNLDFFYNRELQQNDLLGSPTGHTVFNLDCRDVDGKQLLAYIVVLDDEGGLAAVKPIKKRAESVNMKNTDTVLFASVGEAGAFLWQWREGAEEQTKLPFYADSHTLWYSASNDAYFGMEMASQTQKNSPSIAAAYSAEGEQTFSYLQDGAHINYVTVDDGNIYLSLRASAALQKVNMETSEIEWVLGGTQSDFTIFDIDGNEYVPTGEDTWRDNFGSWHHQHKFQQLDAIHFSLFDNHVNEEKSFIDDEVSRMVILEIDEEAKTAQEVFAFKTGDQAMIYGGADVLPSGNVVGSSYPDFVYPGLEDQSYQQNLWEVTPEGEVAWRVGVRGPNPWNPEDLEAPYSHRIDICEEAPVGWVVFNVERFYEQPSVAQPCATDEGAVRFLAFNTIRTQDDGQGVAFLYDMEAKATVANQVFSFQKSWLPRAVEMAVPEDARDAPLSLVVVNAWKDSAKHSIGAFSDLPQCSETHQNRIIN